jgi:diaminohydroxyphosphoribosylaminopyrimidine deaminase/5-amino-6-(5-phosphoribosylamino)uracil reductase
VFVACPDPNPLASGGAEILRQSGVSVTMGLLAEEAAWINRQFLLHQAAHRPLISLKAAVTQEGFIARLDGTSKWITETEAREHGHRLRALRGAVLVGRRTVEIDHPSLTARIPGVQHQPRRIVLDPRAQVDPSEACLAPPQGLRVVGVQTGREGDLFLEAPGGKFSMRRLVESLGSLGMTGLLVEGGGATHRAFLQEGLADEIHLYRSPRTFGEGVQWDGGLGIDLAQSGWEMIEEERLGPDRHQFWIKKSEMMGTILPASPSD